MYRITILFITLFISVWAYSSIPQSADSTLTWQQHYEEAQRCERHSLVGRALSHYESALVLHPSDTIRRDISRCLFQRGYFRKSIQLSQQLLYPDSLDEDLQQIARSYEKLEKIDSANIYRKVVAERDVENYSNTLTLAQNFIKLNEPIYAIFYLENYALNDSTNLIINALRAYTYYESQVYESAIALYEEVIAAGDDDISNNYYLGLCYLRSQETGALWKAHERLKHALELSRGSNPVILGQLGMLRCQIGQAEEGMANIREAITKLQPEPQLLTSLWRTLGETYTMLRDFKAALPCYEKVAELNPKQPKWLYQIAYTHYMLHDDKNEERYTRRFVEAVKQSGEEQKYTKLLSEAEERLKALKTERFFRGE
ncbi:MAG: tetratricopeptide repeat protein [Bacteroides sp.]